MDEKCQFLSLHASYFPIQVLKTSLALQEFFSVTCEPAMLSWRKLSRDPPRGSPGAGAHCTEIGFALSFGAVLVIMIDLSKTESRDFFGIILGQENS